MKVFISTTGIEPKAVARLKHLLKGWDAEKKLMKGGESGYEIQIGDTEDLQKLRDLKNKFPTGVELRENTKSSLTYLIEADRTAEEIVRALSDNSFLQFSLNALAIDLVSGDQGDLVIDGATVWIFTDSEEHADRIINYITYDPRYSMSDTHNLDVIPKYPGRAPHIQEDSSWKIQIVSSMNAEDQKLYNDYGENKYFYFRDEYTNFF